SPVGLGVEQHLAGDGDAERQREAASASAAITRHAAQAEREEEEEEERREDEQAPRRTEQLAGDASQQGVLKEGRLAGEPVAAGDAACHVEIVSQDETEGQRGAGGEQQEADPARRRRPDRQS